MGLVRRIRGVSIKRAVSLVFVGAVAIMVLDHPSDAVSQTYTGCVSASGSLSKVNENTTPTKPCSSKQTEITWTSDAPTGPLGLESTSCPTGQALTGFDSSGGIICATP